eukprot:1157236-Pelagomonas_calceolata.AAC.3
MPQAAGAAAKAAPEAGKGEAQPEGAPAAATAAPADAAAAAAPAAADAQRGGDVEMTEAGAAPATDAAKAEGGAGATPMETEGPAAAPADAAAQPAGGQGEKAPPAAAEATGAEGEGGKKEPARPPPTEVSAQLSMRWIRRDGWLEVMDSASSTRPAGFGCGMPGCDSLSSAGAFSDEAVCVCLGFKGDCRVCSGYCVAIRKVNGEVALGRQEAEVALAGAHKLLPVLGSIWDVRKLQDVWNLLHMVLLDHAYAAAPESGHKLMICYYVSCIHTAMDATNMVTYEESVLCAQATQQHNEFIIVCRVYITANGLDVALVKGRPRLDLCYMERTTRVAGSCCCCSRYICSCWYSIVDVFVQCGHMQKKGAKDILSQPYGTPPAINQPPAYPVTRLREDYKRAHGTSLHIAPLGFANLVEFLQWAPVFGSVVAVDRPQQKGEKGGKLGAYVAIRRGCGQGAAEGKERVGGSAEMCALLGLGQRKIGRLCCDPSWLWAGRSRREERVGGSAGMCALLGSGQRPLYARVVFAPRGLVSWRPGETALQCVLSRARQCGQSGVHGQSVGRQECMEQKALLEGKGDNKNRQTHTYTQDAPPPVWTAQGPAHPAGAAHVGVGGQGC